MHRCIAIIVSVAISGCDANKPSPNDRIAPPQDVSTPTARKVEHRAVVTITPAAAGKLRAARPDAKFFVRVVVEKGGSTGFMYDMKFDDRHDPANDYTDESQGIAIVVDKRSALFLEGATIDWQTNPDGNQGFHFDNPNALK